MSKISALLIKLFSGRFIAFTGRSTKTYKGGLKDLELKNKKIAHYCQEGKTFSVLLLHIY
jgi:hypothetical protein